MDNAGHMLNSPAQEIERYLRTGEHASHFFGWPGDDFVTCSRNGKAALLDALVSTVHERAPHATTPPALDCMDPVAFTRAKTAPMVRGLFPRDEQETVLDVLARSVVFLTPTTIENVLRETGWLSTAWQVANVYLRIVGAEPLSLDAPNIVGLSEGTTCYVSTEYFRGNGSFDDFVVHEAAHVFHDCKREKIGLPARRAREWLLEINFRKRETFAYACEAYSRILELGDDLPARQMLMSQIECGPMPADDRVDAAEYLDILREAVAGRNGWKHILDRCSAPRQTRPRRLGAT